MNSHITIETYRDYTLTSEVIHCGVGGNIWSIKVKRPDGKLIGTYKHETHCEAEREAKEAIHKDIMYLCVQFTPDVSRALKEIESRKN